MVAGAGGQTAPIARREPAEHEVGARMKRNVVALLGRQREIFRMGLAVVARIYPYDHARAPSYRELIVHAKAYSASSPTTKPLASLLRTLPPDKSVANGISSKVTASSSACKQSIRRGRTTFSFMLSTHINDGRSHGALNSLLSQDLHSGLLTSIRELPPVSSALPSYFPIRLI